MRYSMIFVEAQTVNKPNTSFAYLRVRLEAEAIAGNAPMFIDAL